MIKDEKKGVVPPKSPRKLRSGFVPPKPPQKLLGPKNPTPAKRPPTKKGK